MIMITFLAAHTNSITQNVTRPNDLSSLQNKTVHYLMRIRNKGMPILLMEHNLY